MTHNKCPSPAGAFTPSARASARTSARTRGQRTAHAPAPQGLSHPQQGLQPARAGNARRMPQPRRGFHTLSKGFSPHARATHDACPSPAGAFTPSARALARASAHTRGQRTTHAPAPQGLSRPQRGLMVFEELFRYSPRRRASPRIAEGFSPTARGAYRIKCSISISPHELNLHQPHGQNVQQSINRNPGGNVVWREIV